MKNVFISLGLLALLSVVMVVLSFEPAQSAEECNTLANIEGTYAAAGYELYLVYDLTGEAAKAFITKTEGPSGDTVMIFGALYEGEVAPNYLIEIFEDGCAKSEAVVGIPTVEATVGSILRGA